MPEIPETELVERFVRATGPGGQNVNKVSTAVELRFDIANSPSLPEDLRARLLARRDRRVTNDGVLVISAQRFRTQDRNREDARDRLRAFRRGRPARAEDARGDAAHAGFEGAPAGCQARAQYDQEGARRCARMGLTMDEGYPRTSARRAACWRSPPNVPRVPPNRLARWIGRTVLRLGGWRMVGEMPDVARLVLIGAPHSSNWDGIWGFAAKAAMGIDIRVLGKDALFRVPLVGVVLRALGVIPVDRSNPKGVVEQAADMIRKARRRCGTASRPKARAAAWSAGRAGSGRSRAPPTCRCCRSTSTTPTRSSASARCGG